MSPSADTVHGADEISLRVLPDAASLATVRLFAASVGSVFEIAEERVDDLKLVLSELCAGSVLGSEPFEVKTSVVGGSLQLVCRGVADADDDPDADRRQGILEALIPAAVYGVRTVTFAIDL